MAKPKRKSKTEKIDPKKAVRAVQFIRDLLFVEFDDDDKPVVNPNKEWDVEFLDYIAEEIRKVVKVGDRVEERP